MALTRPQSIGLTTNGAHMLSGASVALASWAVAAPQEAPDEARSSSWRYLQLLPVRAMLAAAARTAPDLALAAAPPMPGAATHQ